MPGTDAHSEKLKLFELMVNGNRVFKWAVSSNHAKILARIDAQKKAGKYNITDCRFIRNKN